MNMSYVQGKTLSMVIITYLEQESKIFNKEYKELSTQRNNFIFSKQPKHERYAV